MWLILGQDSDRDAAELADRLRSAGLEPLELILATQLVHGARWEHRVGGWGSSTRLRLAGGRVIDSSDVHGVLNRLLWITADGFLGASDTDRDYAGGELYALVLSWLESFRARAINRPSGFGLSGPWRTPDQWRALARTAGLEIRAFPDPPGQPPELTQVLVIDGEIVEESSAPAALREGALRLAAGLGHDLVELRFDQDWRFADATLLPNLVNGGEARIRAVARALRARAA